MSRHAEGRPRVTVTYEQARDALELAGSIGRAAISLGISERTVRRLVPEFVSVARPGRPAGPPTKKAAKLGGEIG